MSKIVKAHIPLLVLIILLFAACNVYAANKVVVIPLEKDSSPALEARIESLESQMTTLDSQVTVLESQVTTLQSKVASLEASHTGVKHVTAYGSIVRNNVGTQYTEGVSSVVWNDTYDRYELTFTDAYFSWGDTATVSILGDSSICAAGCDGRVDSVSGKLLVYIVNASGDKVQCSFSFVVFAD